MSTTTRPANVTACLQGDARYDAASVAPLEAYVRSSGTFDLEAALALLKLYQFHPTALNKEVIEIVLVKALADGHFGLCAYMLNAATKGDEKISKIFALSEALETANYKTFWKLLEGTPNDALAERARRKMLAAVSLAYQRIGLQVLAGMLNVSPGAALDALIATQAGWVKDGNDVVLPPSAKHQPTPPKMSLSVEQKLAVLGSTKH